MTHPDESGKLAYSLRNFAKAVDHSEDAIRLQIKAGNLVPVYVNSKPLIPKAEAERWLNSLPQEPKRAS
jgi:hypothetical protein